MLNVINRAIFFVAILPCSVSAEYVMTDDKGFITHEHALRCIQMGKDVVASHQHLLTFETRKASLKNKINYLHEQIELRRQKITELDQQHYQENNKSYNLLIAQFEELVEERKHTITIYNNENKKHLAHGAENVTLQNTYTEQCLNHIQITEILHKKVCPNSNTKWCTEFTF